MEVKDLRDAPEFFDAVADRIWRAWWKPGGAGLADVEQALAAVVSSDGFPFTLVASAHGAFAGTVTVIANDLSARPDLSPWIAALWVEPDARGQNLGRLMLGSATRRLRLAGYTAVYLGARPALRLYYTNGGWTLIDEGAGPDGLDIFSLSLEPLA